MSSSCLVPTLRVGTRRWTLCVPRIKENCSQYNAYYLRIGSYYCSIYDAERLVVRYNAERCNEQIRRKTIPFRFSPSQERVMLT